jgi:hypothetical protein
MAGIVFVVLYAAFHQPLQWWLAAGRFIGSGDIWYKIAGCF